MKEELAAAVAARAVRLRPAASGRTNAEFKTYSPADSDATTVRWDYGLSVLSKIKTRRTVLIGGNSAPEAADMTSRKMSAKCGSKRSAVVSGDAGFWLHSHATVQHRAPLLHSDCHAVLSFF